MKYIKKLELNKHTVRMPIFGELVETITPYNRERNEDRTCLQETSD